MAYVPDEAINCAHEIPAAALRMYLYFCMRRDAETGVCFPSLKRTAADLELKYSYASEMRSLLVDKGWVEIEHGDIRPLKGFRKNPKEVSEKTEHESSENSETMFGKSRTDVRQNPKQVSTFSETPTITTPINQPNQPNNGAGRASPVVEVFDHWRAVMAHPVAKLTPEREKAVRARLRDGYTVEEIKAGIDGCRASPFHMGQNDGQKRHDDLTLICRTGSKLESFMAMKDAPKGVAGVRRTTSAENAADYLRRREERRARRDRDGDSGDEPSAVPDPGGDGVDRRDVARAS